MEILKTSLHIGIKEPFTVLHASDTHLTLCDERNDERKLVLSCSRKKTFPSAEYNLEFIKNKALTEGRTLIHSGDVIDFVSEKNLEEAKRLTDTVDCFVSAGNHEFSLYVGEAKEDATYRNQSLDRVQASFTNNIRYSSRIIGGVNFVAIDNSYYLIDEEQLEFLKRETEREYPVILVVHIPLYSEEFYAFSREYPENPANLLAVPEYLMRDYSTHRYEQQLADKLTYEAYDFILGCKNIRAILSGHIHRNFECKITESIYQISTGTSSVREIYID